MHPLSPQRTMFRRPLARCLLVGGPCRYGVSEGAAAASGNGAPMRTLSSGEGSQVRASGLKQALPSRAVPCEPRRRRSIHRDEMANDASAGRCPASRRAKERVVLRRLKASPRRRTITSLGPRARRRGRGTAPLERRSRICNSPALASRQRSVACGRVAAAARRAHERRIR